MKPIIYNEKDLPMKELQALGLADNGQLLLNAQDLRALLSGSRTSMLNFTDLEDESLKIESLDAKISLRTGADGQVELLLHPIYHKPATPDFLDETDAQKLETGEVANLLKIITDKHGNKKELLVEYDADTREFIVSDSEKIIAPETVNSEQLSADQKLRYRKGKEVEMDEGTILQYAAKEPDGIRSNRLALVASILIDGGISYLLYKGLHALFGKEAQEKEAELLSAGYHQAMTDLENQQSPMFKHYDAPGFKQKR